MTMAQDVSQQAPARRELPLRLPDELLDELGVHAADAERGGRLSDAALAVLRDARCLRMAVASEYGGDDLDLADVLFVVESLARVDGALGWAVGQVALSQVMLGYLDRPAVERIYAASPDVLAAGAAAPKGRATRDKDAWRISGQWPLVSGAQYATWLFLQCIVVEDGRVQMDAEGVPEMRMVVLPADAATVLPTWDAVGLRGTGSDDVRAHNAPCEDGWTATLAVADAGDAAIARIAPPAQGGLFVAACALGIAAGALDELTALVRGGKRPAFSPQRLADQPIFQGRLGDAQLTLAAGRALLHEEVARASALAVAGELDAIDRSRLRAAAAKAVELGTRVVDTSYGLAGGSSVYSRSPLQRRLRDAHTATQHFTAGRDFYAPLGALLLGEPADPRLT